MAAAGDASLAPWEKDGAPPSRTAGMMAWGVLALVTGAVALGTGAAKVIPQASTLQTLASTWVAGGGSALSVNLLVGSSYASAVVVVLGVLGIVSNKINSRPMAAAALVAVMLISALQIVSGIMYKGTVKQAYDTLQPNPYTASFSATQLAFVDTGNAVFNECCNARFVNATNISTTRKDGIQAVIKECPSDKGLSPNDERVCTALPKVITDVKDFINIADVLCTCYTQSSYNAILKFVKANDMCTKLQSTTVSADGLQLPTTSVSMTFSDLLDTVDKMVPVAEDKLGPYLPIKTMTMTGQLMPRDPWAINGVPPSSGVEGWACGLGYAKGVTWIQQVYIDQTGSIFALVLILAGAVQLLASGLVFVFWAMGGGSSNEEAWADYEKGAVSPAPKAPEM
jgi:hypothetical protein